MAAIVKANSSLAAGGLAVLRRQFSTTDDGTCNYEADYACLSQFANAHVGRFRTGSEPPTAIPASMFLLRLISAPILYDFTSNTQAGITYFNARYTAASSEPGEVITTESSEQRSVSGTVVGSIRGNFTGFGIGTQNAFVNISFDYISISVRVEAKNPANLPQIKGRVGQIFNRSVDAINNTVPTIGAGQIKEALIETTSKTRSSRGTFTFSKTSSGVFQINPLTTLTGD